MKKTLILALTLLLAALLASCGCDPGGDVVFVSQDGAPVGSVGYEGPIGGGYGQNADGTALIAGGSISIDSGDVGFPMTVTACAGLATEDPIASVVIPKAPPEGERWFVTLRSGGKGPYLTYDAAWPLED